MYYLGIVTLGLEIVSGLVGILSEGKTVINRTPGYRFASLVIHAVVIYFIYSALVAYPWH